MEEQFKNMRPIEVNLNEPLVQSGWTLHSVAKKFRVTQAMDKSVIVLNRDSYQVMQADASKE